MTPYPLERAKDCSLGSRTGEPIGSNFSQRPTVLTEVFRGCCLSLGADLMLYAQCQIKRTPSSVLYHNSAVDALL
jgi:hypothetical protein